MLGGQNESAAVVRWIWIVNNYLAYMPTCTCQPTTGGDDSAIAPRSLPTHQPLLPMPLEFNHDITVMRDEGGIDNRNNLELPLS